MLKSKISLLLISTCFTAGLSSMAVAEVSQQEFSTGLQTASADGSNVADYALAQMQTTPADQADILGFALQAASGDTDVIKQVLSAAVTAGMSADDILVIAIANGIDPAIVAEIVEETQTAGGGAFGAAPAPGAPGFGGGSGGGGGTISTN